MKTRQIVQTYHSARFTGDATTAIALLAPGFTFTSPLMRSDAAGHLASLDTFLQIVTGVDMISELYGDAEATLVYDVHTATPVGTQRTAEHFAVTDGRITSINLIFDASGWRAMIGDPK
jgi:hypothetical protein